jgi:hypothetical protein
VYSWWELVFKAVTGGPFGAYDLFISNNTRNTDNMAARQLTNQILDHYKSDVINDWQNSGISKVRYLLIFFLFQPMGFDNATIPNPTNGAPQDQCLDWNCQLSPSPSDTTTIHGQIERG